MCSRCKMPKMCTVCIGMLQATGYRFAITAICLIVLPRPTVSETEKRKLATFPDFTWKAYWSGDYAEDISYYFNDTVPFRDTFKSIGATFRSLFGY